MYGGGTFEIKSCSFWYPGGIHLQYRSYKWRTDALQILYGRATDAYIPSIDPRNMKDPRFQSPDQPSTNVRWTLIALIYALVASR